MQNSDIVRFYFRAESAQAGNRGNRGTSPRIPEFAHNSIKIRYLCHLRKRLAWTIPHLIGASGWLFNESLTQPLPQHAMSCKLNVMALNFSDIYSLSEFQRNTRDHITKLKATGNPAVLTVNGQAEVVVQSAEAYQRLIDDQEILENLRSISRGLEQAKRGEGRPMREFLETLAGEHGITLR